MTEMVMAPVSYGELIDKITILELKAEHITEHAKHLNVMRELDHLNRLWASLGLALDTVEAEITKLREVNAQLWRVEDELRAMEAEQRFEAEFVQAARSVYKLNDQRAAHKREINLILGSPLVEEKSYTPTASTGSPS